MGLTSFLKQQGLIKDDDAEKQKGLSEDAGSSTKSDSNVSLVFFPLEPSSNSCALQEPPKNILLKENSKKKIPSFTATRSERTRNGIVISF